MLIRFDGFDPQELQCLADDGTGEGGGGGAPADNEPKGEGGGDSDSADDFQTQVNSAIVNHLSRFQKTNNSKIQSVVAEATAPLIEQVTQLTDLVGKLSAGNHDDHAEGEGGKSKSKDPMVAQLQAEMKRRDQRLAELESKLEEERAEKERVAQEQQRAEMRSAVLKTLTENGVSARRAKSLMYEFEIEGKVQRDAAGNLMFMVPGPAYAEDPEGMDLSEGIKDFLKSDEGKEFVTAKSTAGSGASETRVATRGVVRTGANPTYKEIIDAARQKLGQ